MPQMRDPMTGKTQRMPYGDEAADGAGMRPLDSQQLPPELLQLLMQILGGQQGPGGV